MSKSASKLQCPQQKLKRLREFRIASCGKYSKTRLKTYRSRIMARLTWRICTMEPDKLLQNLSTWVKKASIWTTPTSACGERQTTSHSTANTRITMLHNFQTAMVKSKCSWLTSLLATQLFYSLTIHLGHLQWSKDRTKFLTTVLKETLEVQM